MELVIALLLYKGKYSEAMFDDGSVVDFELMKMFLSPEFDYKPLRLMQVLREEQVNAHTCMHIHLYNNVQFMKFRGEIPWGPEINKLSVNISVGTQRVSTLSLEEQAKVGLRHDYRTRVCITCMYDCILMCASSLTSLLEIKMLAFAFRFFSGGSTQLTRMYD